MIYSTVYLVGKYGDFGANVGLHSTQSWQFSLCTCMRWVMKRDAGTLSLFRLVLFLTRSYSGCKRYIVPGSASADLIRRLTSKVSNFFFASFHNGKDGPKLTLASLPAILRSSCYCSLLNFLIYIIMKWLTDLLQLTGLVVRWLVIRFPLIFLKSDWQ